MLDAFFFQLDLSNLAWMFYNYDEQGGKLHVTTWRLLILLISVAQSGIFSGLEFFFTPYFSIAKVLSFFRAQFQEHYWIFGAFARAEDPYLSCLRFSSLMMNHRYFSLVQCLFLLSFFLMCVTGPFYFIYFVDAGRIASSHEMHTKETAANEYNVL